MWITFDQILEMKSTSSSVVFFMSVGLIYKLCICFLSISRARCYALSPRKANSTAAASTLAAVSSVVAYNNQLNGGSLAVDCNDDNNDGGNSNSNGNGNSKGDGDGKSNGGGTL